MKKIIKVIISLIVFLFVSMQIEDLSYAEESEDWYYEMSDDGTVRIRRYYGSDEKVIVPSEWNGIKVTAIYTIAFLGNKNLTEVVLPDTIEYIYHSAFAGCENLVTINLPDGLKEIGGDAFQDCSSLVNINIPSGVYVIYDNFEGCTSLVNINVDKGNDRYTSIDGVLYNKDLSRLIRYPEGKKETSYNIPKGVEYIDDYAFYNCDNLTNIIIPEGVKKIRAHAFCGCDNLTNIIIPESVEYIGYDPFGGDHVFSGCSNLEIITILSPDCEFESDILGENTNTVISGYANSTAYEYAKKYNRKFVEIICDHKNKLVIDRAMASTCTKTGLTEGSHCSVCKEIIKPQTTIKATGHTYKNVVTKATLTKNGKITPTCIACKAKKLPTTIYAPKTIKLSKTSYTYNGKTQKPKVTVKDSKGKTISSKYYTVTYDKGCKNVSKYNVKITFKGNYSGTKTLSYTINPNSTSISKLTAGKKKFTVKWKKQNSQTTGYEIQYATNKSFKNAKKVTVTKNSTTSKSISKLSAKKKYYVRIRTYKTVKVNGKSVKLYSSWSNTKSVTTKK